MANAQRKPLALSLNKLVLNKVQDIFQMSGQPLPCTVVSNDNSIVVVNFEVNSKFNLANITVPIWGAEYIRYPITAGCKGCVFPANVRLSGVSGIGGGIADMSQPANLTALVFAPISNTSWSETDDPDAVVIYGPNGVVLRDTGKASTITITPSGIVMVTPEVTITTTGDVTVNCGGTVNITTADDVNVNCSGDATVQCVAGNITASGSLSLTSEVSIDLTATTSVSLTAVDIALTGIISLNGPITQTETSAGTSASLIGPLAVTNEVTGNGIALSTHPHNVIGVELGGATLSTTAPT